ncbi:MAG: T9SS type A sorting domain-containing protein [Ignavibacteria bacterium]|nr:T9SS type A sorting domain-containing protein [Ignavibacteria bacterium]
MKKLLVTITVILYMVSIVNAQSVGNNTIEQVTIGKIRKLLPYNVPSKKVFVAPVDYTAMSKYTETNSLVIEFTGNENTSDKVIVQQFFRKGSIIYTFDGIDDLYSVLNIDGTNRSNFGGKDRIYAIKQLENGVIADIHISNKDVANRGLSLDSMVINRSESNLTEYDKKNMIDFNTLKINNNEMDFTNSSIQALNSWIESTELKEQEITTPGNAWSYIYYTRWTGSSSAYNIYFDFNCYKLVDNSNTQDYYLLATTITSEIVSPKSGDDATQWLVKKRQLILDGNYYDQTGRTTMLLEHGPTTTVPNITTGFSIGGSVSASVNSGLGAGLSASYSESWSNPCITTTDLSNNSNVVAEWQENFPDINLPVWTCPTISCTPAKATYLSKTSAIFKVSSSSCPSMFCKVAIGADIDLNHYWCWGGLTYGIDSIGNWDWTTSAGYWIQWGRNLQPVITNHTPEFSPQTVNVGGYLDFSCSAVDSDGCQITYTWYKDNQQVSNGSTWRYTPNCDEPDTRTVKVVASDPLGATSQYSWTVNINKNGGKPGTPSISGNSEVCEGLTLQLTASSTGNPTSWSWSSGCGGTFSPQNSSSTTWTAPTGFNGNCQISVTATNSCGTSSQGTKSVTVNPKPHAPDQLITNLDSVHVDSVFTLSWHNVFGADNYKLFENDTLLYIGTRTDTTLSRSKANIYHYKLQACNFCGCNDTVVSLIVTVIVTTIETDKYSLPSSYALSQNYPNPFNPMTTIKYDLPREGIVLIKIYDMLGREVKTLIHEYKNAGSYNIEFNASNLSSGIYFYRLTAGDFTKIKKLILIK